MKKSWKLSLQRRRHSAGLEVVWKPFLALAVIGAVFFTVALRRFRKTIGTMQEP